MGARSLGLASTIVLALGIDTSTPRVSVAVVDDGALLARRDDVVDNAHGELLAIFVDHVLREAGAATTDLRAVGVGLGPGPFTSLRVGVMTAASLGDALDIPAFGMCSLDTITDPSVAGEPYAVVTDARRRQFYWAIYDRTAARIEGPEISTPDELAGYFRDRVQRVIGPVAEVVRWPDAALVAAHAHACLRLGETPEPLTPLYLRRPDAREPGPPKKVTPA
jgi:tRNA threonylcarbamoyl adenosine modification protein YeaZ